MSSAARRAYVAAARRRFLEERAAEAEAARARLDAARAAIDGREIPDWILNPAPLAARGFDAPTVSAGAMLAEAVAQAPADEQAFLDASLFRLARRDLLARRYLALAASDRVWLRAALSGEAHKVQLHAYQAWERAYVEGVTVPIVAPTLPVGASGQAWLKRAMERADAPGIPPGVTRSDETWDGVSRYVTPCKGIAYEVRHTPHTVRRELGVNAEGQIIVPRVALDADGASPAAVALYTAWQAARRQRLLAHVERRARHVRVRQAWLLSEPRERASRLWRERNPFVTYTDPTDPDAGPRAPETPREYLSGLLGAMSPALALVLPENERWFVKDEPAYRKAIGQRLPQSEALRRFLGRDPDARMDFARAQARAHTNRRINGRAEREGLTGTVRARDEASGTGQRHMARLKAAIWDA